jgi:hypothetical protein
MKKLFKLNLKLFFENRYLLISYGAMLLICNVYLIWECVKVTETVDFVRLMLRLGIIGFIFFLFLGYEYMKRTEHVFLHETVSAIPKGLFKIYLTQLICLFLPVAIYFVNILAYGVVLYFVRNVQYTPFLYHIIKNGILNILLVACVGTLFGSIISLKCKRIAAYLIMIFVIFCVSPVFENVSFSLLELWGINIYPYWDVFRILAPNLDWTSEKIYGFAIEACRWDLIGFWLVALSAAFLWMVERKNNNRIKIICGVFVAVSVVCFTLYLQPGSIVRMDYRSDGVLHGDYYYETEDPAAIDDTVEIAADFDVLAYDMTLTVDRQLDADVLITLQTPSDITDYTFTLYRGYTVSSVTDENGNALEYERTGHYLTIHHTFPNEISTIEIKYKGSGNKYYSNSQGIALPGYFPYYPMAGHLKLWNSETCNIVVNTDFSAKQFTVTVNSDLDIISNLDGTGHTFTGTSETVTIIGGFVTQKRIGDLTVANYAVDPIDSSDLLNAEEQWEKIKTLVGETRDISFEGKTFFLLPFTINAGVGDGNENIVYLDDQILVSMWSNYNAETISEYLLDSLIPLSRTRTI